MFNPVHSYLNRELDRYFPNRLMMIRTDETTEVISVLILPTMNLSGYTLRMEIGSDDDCFRFTVTDCSNRRLNDITVPMLTEANLMEDSILVTPIRSNIFTGKEA